jgi:hypothetical protein
MGESFGLVIDNVFTDVLRSYGFAMAAPHGKYFDGITYVNGNRAVEAYWIRTRGQYCTVGVRAYGQDPVYIADVRYFVSDDPTFVSTNDQNVFKAEAERLRDLLLEYCDDFLRGNVAAFRERYRGLVKRFETANTTSGPVS